MIVRQKEDDLLRSPPEIVNHSHSAALAACSTGDSPTELSAASGTDNYVTGRRVNQEMTLHSLIVFVLKEIANEFGKHRRLDEGEFHGKTLRQ